MVTTSATHRPAIIAIASLVLFVLSAFSAPAAQADGGYRLPYTSGFEARLSQGWNGQFSHTGLNRFAYDFQMPEGTPIVASKAGRVVAVKRDVPSWMCGGRSLISLANYVVLQHEDGAQTLYLHLSGVGRDRVVGSLVKEGQVLGWSGKTGWTECGAHLHFAKQNKATGTTAFGQSIPVYFNEYMGKQLQVGTKYRSQNSPPRW